MISQSSGETGSQRSPVHLNWQDFQESALKDQELNRRMAAKSLDLPYDTMGNISVTNTKSGLGGWAAAALLAAGMAGGGGAFIAAQSLLNRPEPPQQAPAPDQITETKTYDYNVEMEVERR